MSTIAIHYATMTGNAELLARRALDAIVAAGPAAELYNLADLRPDDLERLARAGRTALFVVSTWGDGEPPADAADFWYALEKAPLSLVGLRHAVFGLGDHDYTYFNAFARQLDERLSSLGSLALLPRGEAGLDFDEPFDVWLPDVIAQVVKTGASV